MKTGILGDFIYKTYLDISFVSKYWNISRDRAMIYNFRLSEIRNFEFINLERKKTYSIFSEYSHTGLKYSNIRIQNFLFLDPLDVGGDNIQRSKQTLLNSIQIGLPSACNLSWNMAHNITILCSPTWHNHHHHHQHDHDGTFGT